MPDHVNRTSLVYHVKWEINDDIITSKNTIHPDNSENMMQKLHGQQEILHTPRISVASPLGTRSPPVLRRGTRGPRGLRGAAATAVLDSRRAREARRLPVPRRWSHRIMVVVIWEILGNAQSEYLYGL